MRNRVTFRELWRIVVPFFIGAGVTAALLVILLAALLAPGWGAFFGTSSPDKGAGRRVYVKGKCNHPDARRPAPISSPDKRD